MEKRTFIPNEKMVILAVRYDSIQMPQEEISRQLSGFMQLLDSRFTPPTETDPVSDGSLDWSLTHLNHVEPVARVRVVGEILSVESVMPVTVIDDDFLTEELWLDGELLGVDNVEPAGEPNHLALANGNLPLRIKQIRNENKYEGYEVRYVRYDQHEIDEGYWLGMRGQEGQCGLPGCELPPYAQNPTAVPDILCETHYMERHSLTATGVLVPVNRTDAYLPFVDNEPDDAIQLAMWMDRHCDTCGTVWGDHFGERCPVGGGYWVSPLDFIGFDDAGNRLHRGDEDRLHAYRNGLTILAEDRAAYLKRLALEKELVDANEPNIHDGTEDTTPATGRAMDHFEHIVANATINANIGILGPYRIEEGARTALARLTPTTFNDNEMLDGLDWTTLEDGRNDEEPEEGPPTM